VFRLLVKSINKNALLQTVFFGDFAHWESTPVVSKKRKENWEERKVYTVKELSRSMSDGGIKKLSSCYFNLFIIFPYFIINN